MLSQKYFGHFPQIHYIADNAYEKRKKKNRTTIRVKIEIIKGLDLRLQNSSKLLKISLRR